MPSFVVVFVAKTLYRQNSGLDNRSQNGETGVAIPKG
jgi:hypothetical protein